MNLEVSLQNQTADTVHGSLLEAAHISGYSFERACTKLEYLIDEDRWKELTGIEAFSDFLATIDLSAFKMDVPNRKRLAQKMAAKEASQRAIAAALGVTQPTVHNDLADKPLSETPPPHEAEDIPTDNDLSFTPPEVPPPAGMAHVSHNSGESEWYTPKEYIEAACAVMGEIDVDPASNAEANKVVGAAEFFDAEEDGLQNKWWGRIWMNPPYSQPLVDQFCRKLVSDWRKGSVTQACVLVNNATETQWFQAVASISNAICFPQGRVKFWHPERESSTPLQGQAILYIGSEAARFKQAFGGFGLVVERNPET